MIIIPAIDIIDGSCVRLSQGDYSSKKVYNSDPLEVAKMFEDWGLSRLHLVDLDGAKAGKVINYKVLERICNSTSMTVDFGGGIKTDKDIEIAFDSGAQMITGGSIAVKNQERFIFWLEKYGQDRIILGADHKNEKIAVSGWIETSNLDLNNFINDYLKKGVKKVICTDISKDGMLEGSSTELYSRLINQFPGMELIGSGGVGSLFDLQALQEINMTSVIVGKAIYEERISSKEIKQFISD
ncbi:MAG: 1-(5-phosphoribosyl)-5-[(5-phosphoribosylamino)methylideneamino]imidazole-4-carboxamide isomerase [Bacteroidales bacterium]|nr:1-(5-phosphoribosyl)-5-[(5-phosphoribosylamino)methylideneamino]imidazole-4-carboxamide isomerase [Bacteroidales bacterium]